MMTTLAIMWLSGGLVGFGLAVQWAMIAKMHADERLVDRNEYLEEEVTRLRTQVALHIGQEQIVTPDGRREAYPASRSTAGGVYVSP